MNSESALDKKEIARLVREFQGGECVLRLCRCYSGIDGKFYINLIFLSHLSDHPRCEGVSLYKARQMVNDPLCNNEDRAFTRALLKALKKAVPATK